MPRPARDLESVRDLVSSSLQRGSSQRQILGLVNDQLAAQGSASISLRTLQTQISSWGLLQTRASDKLTGLYDEIERLFKDGVLIHDILHHVNAHLEARGSRTISERTLWTQLKAWGMLRYHRSSLHGLDPETEEEALASGGLDVANGNDSNNAAESPDGDAAADGASAGPLTTVDDIPRLRNGRLQACDPCRSRKVACDNRLPVCRRCLDRNLDRDCVYTIKRRPSLVPQRNDARLGRYSPSRGRRRSIRETPRPHSHSQSLDTLAAAATTTSSHSSHTTIDYDTFVPRNISPQNTRPPGYLGAISHSSVYKETLSRLQQTDRAPHGVSPPTTSSPNHVRKPQKQVDGVDETIRRKLTTVVRETCRFVLRSLPIDLDSLSVPPQEPHRPINGWSHIPGQRILGSLQNHMRGRPRTDAALDPLIDWLCANTTKPVTDDVETQDEWTLQYCDDNLRWESVGIFFTFFGSFRIPTSTGPIITDQGTILSTTDPSECLSMCIQTAKLFTDGSLMLLCLCLRSSIALSMVRGEASKSTPLPLKRATLDPDRILTVSAMATRDSHSAAVSLVTYLGLHVLHNPPDYRPTFGSELARHLMTYTFLFDKIETSFSGRPPLLPRCYVTCPLPLDVPDLDFVGDAHTLQTSLSRVDERGWHLDGRMGTSTLVRARALLSYLMDELIELGLSNQNQRHNGSHRMLSSPSTFEVLQDIKVRAEQTISQFPDYLRYDPQQVQDPEQNSTLVYMCIFIRIEYLQVLFLAERLLQRHSEGNAYYEYDSSGLLLVSYEIVSLIVCLWMHKDRFASERTQFDWLVLNFGASGGGILCMELLRPSFFGGAHPRNPAITRSSIIQQLSLLVGFLEWVSPRTSNSGMCLTCRSIIQRVLDHALNNGVGAAAVQQNEGGMAMDGGVGNDVQDSDLPSSLTDPSWWPPANWESLNFGIDLFNTFDWMGETLQ